MGSYLGTILTPRINHVHGTIFTFVNVSMKNEHKRAISEKKNLKITKRQNALLTPNSRQHV